MPYLTTGLIENTSVATTKPCSRLLVEISNDDTSNVAIQIEGYLQSGNLKVKYVDDFFTLAPGTVAQRNYYCLFEAFEFQFFVSSQAVHVSATGKDVAGNLTSAYRLGVEEGISQNMVRMEM